MRKEILLAVNLGPPHTLANTPTHNEKAKEENQKAKTTKTNIMQRVPTGGWEGECSFVIKHLRKKLFW